MTHEEHKIVKQSGKYRIVIADSATSISEGNKSDIFICASHCGVNVGQYAAQANIKGLIGNDAGKGLEDAGVAGLKVIDEKGIPGAAVSAMTAEIGIGVTTYDSGIISSVNKAAQKIGVKPGMTAKEAAEVMLQAAVKTGK